jgi:hypothetical protein
MRTYGFEEKAIAEERQCPICGLVFIARSVRRKYCYCERCRKARYLAKVAKQKLKRKKRKGKS